MMPPLDPEFVRKYKERKQQEMDAAFPPANEPAPPPPPPPETPEPYQFDVPIIAGGVPYTITPDGEVWAEVANRRRKTDSKMLPAEVTAAREYLIPSGDVYAKNNMRLRMPPGGGTPMMFDAASKQWYNLDDDEITGLPQDARGWMAKQLEPVHNNLFTDLQKQHAAYFGDYNLSPQDIAAAEKNILEAANAQRGGKRGVQIGAYTIASPQDLEMARQHAQETGNQEQIAALKNVYIQPGAEGGYVAFLRAPNGQYVMQAVSPDPPKEAVYNWTNDPAQVSIAARQAAQAAKRQQYQQQTGGVRLNNDAVKVAQDYVKKFAPLHRGALLQGEILGEPPERVAAALKQALDSGDRDGAQAIIAEMQNSLADHIGGGYEHLKPGWSGMTMLENGDQLDYNPGIVPPRQPENWDVKTAMIDPPAAQRKKEYNPTGVTWPTVGGGEKPYHESFNEMTAMSGVTPEAFEANHKFIRNQTYNDAEAPMDSPDVGGTMRHPGKLSKDNAQAMYLQSELAKNPSLAKGIKDAAIQSALHATAEMESAMKPTGYEGGPNGAKVEKGMKITKAEYFAKQKELWGTHTTKGDLTPEQMKDAVIDSGTGRVTIPGASAKDDKGNEIKTAGKDMGETWNERTVMAAMNNGGYEVNGKKPSLSALGGVGMTIFNVNNHALAATDPEFAKQYPHFFIDSRLKFIMPTLSRSAAAAMLPVMRNFREKNKDWFDQHLNRSRGEIPYIEGEAEQAADYADAIGAIIKMTSENFGKK